MPRRLKKNEPDLDQEQERAALLRAHELKIEHDKYLIMYTGVSFFMILFVGIWFASFTSAVKNSIPEDKTSESLEVTLDKLRNSLEQAKTDIGQMKNQAERAAQASTTSATSTSQELDIDNLNIEITDQQLEGGNKTASSAAQLPSNQ